MLLSFVWLCLASTVWAVAVRGPRHLPKLPHPPTLSLSPSPPPNPPAAAAAPTSSPPSSPLSDKPRPVLPDPDVDRLENRIAFVIG
ncbi:probable pathogenesis-related protein ARB_02861 [Haliotis rufescens]|uniref:probable pathogenesis-related protein ARB_02861 n=1 Tax=Haliotis rufescens TaxID=6454 RepID=UPI00201EFE5A|nr:probable pathogenesis-related protein ARB_02861 [Haliotis rufescens]